jgi:hypothetical protein
MPLNQTLITQINTPVHGANAQGIVGAGEPGLPAPAATLDVTGDGFFDPSAALELTPAVDGGMGGFGGFGAQPVGPAPMNVGGTLEYYPGDAGGPGGSGGTGGAAIFDFADDTIGSAASPYGGMVAIDASVEGGEGAVGATGGIGGYAGVDSENYVTDYFAEGSTGGVGGNGGAGGAGGSATASIDQLSADMLMAAYITLSATGGAAGLNNGNGGPTGGGLGNEGGAGAETSLGGNGGYGGDGGAATSIISDSSITDSNGISITLKATGGAGGNGGEGGPGGFGENAGLVTANPADLSSLVGYQPWTSTAVNGGNGSGGDGGANGLATAELINNTISTPTALVTLTALSGAPGAGGLGATDDILPIGQTVDEYGDISNVIGSPNGADGSAGTLVPGQLIVTDNTISVPTRLKLALNVEDGVAGNESALPLVASGTAANLLFSGNQFSGDGDSLLDISGIDAPGGVVDDQNDTLSFDGQPDNGMSGFDTFYLGPDETFIAGSSGPQVVVSAPDPDTIVLTPGHSAVDIEGGINNTILQFAGYGSALDSTAQLQADTTSNSNDVTINVPGDGAVTLETPSWTPQASNVVFAASVGSVPCFCSGTPIRTARGEVNVEVLRVGDCVRTHFSRSAQVQWLGHRRIDCDRHPRPQDVWPVRIAAGAFGKGLPRRDLWLSPEHAVFVRGTLIPVRHLINGTTILQVAVAEMTYWHVELPRHDVIQAAGLWCETYLDNGNRSAFANGGAAVDLFADFAPDERCEALWEAHGCAPLHIHGEVVAKVAARLRRLAARLRPPAPRRPGKRSRRRIAGTQASSPGRLLRPVWYRKTYPDVADAGLDAATHYAQWGRIEGRLPCAETDLMRGLGLIDPGTVALTMADVVAARADPVAHFCAKGWRERRRPNPYFETGWYLDTHDVPPEMNPLLHYVLVGERMGLPPGRHFDPAWYRQRYAIAPDDLALAHYLQHRRTRRVSPLPSFNLEAYIDVYGDTLRPGGDPYMHFRTVERFTRAPEHQADRAAA